MKRSKKMRNRTLILGLTAVLCLVGSSLQAQKPADLAGAWSGQATLEGLDAPNELTLVLELKEGKLAGTLTDQYGTINQFPISDIVLDKGTLSFSSPVVGRGGEQMSIKFKMTLSGGAMKGEIEVPEMGMKGAWEAAKIK
jgi:hypothetical protein